MVILFTAETGEKVKYCKASRMTNELVTSLFLHQSNEEELHLSSLFKTMAVRNPAGIRLGSSSLVNKQVGWWRICYQRGLRRLVILCKG